ncbi:hypothetical protein F5Y15DRAFT_221274 [Xylariaceae sp. FL0016]|nr:hypothetical protein F5Y15DRAFT_221274 [Xylariaceae sp. FL0016]
MFHSKVPRVFVVASFLLCFLVTYTTFYLYHHVPPSYPTANSPAAPISDATLVLDDVPVVQNIEGHVFNPAESNPTETAQVSDATDLAPSEQPEGNGDGSTDQATDQTTGDTTVPATDSADGTQKEENAATDNIDQSQRVSGQVTDVGTTPGQTTDTWSSPAGGSAVQAQQPLLLPDPKDCPRDLEFLVRASVDLGLTESVRYTRRRIRPVYSNKVDRNEIANISEPLLKDEVEVDMWDCWDAQIPNSAPIKLQVPQPYAQQSYKHLIFGIATDYKRLNDSILPFSHWLSGTGAKLVATVTDMSQKMPDEVRRLELAFADADIDATLVAPLDDAFTTSQNHFTVLVSMLEVSTPETQWFGLLDDDTFFPSLKPLSDSLATVDYKTDAYVGTLSEDFVAVRLFGFMAFGGAGAYLSPSLARKLGEQVFKCLYEASSIEGDIIIRDCVYTNSKAKLTILPGLFQQDMRTDVSGFFEAGFRPINLHHWKSWYHEPVAKMAAAADLCGDCFLQRWRFGNDTLFANGYSITTYRDGVDAVDLSLVEGTWERADRDYDFSVGPLRPKLSREQKRSYVLRDVEVTDRGDLRQLYVRENNPEVGELDEVVELIWEKH